MHKYLRAVGFYNILHKSEENDILKRMEEEYTTCSHYQDSFGEDQVEMDIALAPGAGVILRGTLDEQKKFHREFYFPYLQNEEKTVGSPSEIDRKLDKDAYSCMCDEARLGISLIFHLINSMDFSRSEKNIDDITGCCLSALSIRGRVLIPLQKTENQMQAAKQLQTKRKELVEAARQGDEAAIESLTLQDMTNYASINRRLNMNKEDLYSVVETLFMPFGSECDEYSILANILKVDTLENKWTKETMYRLELECNDITFPLLINSRDLLGVPEAGRRFKGDIWMQGSVLFDSEESV